MSTTTTIACEVPPSAESTKTDTSPLADAKTLAKWSAVWENELRILQYRQPEYSGASVKVAFSHLTDLIDYLKITVSATRTKAVERFIRVATNEEKSQYNDGLQDDCGRPMAVDDLSHFTAERAMEEVCRSIRHQLITGVSEPIEDIRNPQGDPMFIARVARSSATVLNLLTALVAVDKWLRVEDRSARDELIEQWSDICGEDREGV